MKKRSTPKTWALKILTAILSPVLFLLLVEGILRLFGYGVPVKFFLPVGDGDAFTGNPRYTYRFFPKQLVREPDIIRMDREKAEGAYRIFVLGGSAARGTPDPRFGFGRILEVMLEEAYPEREFEVINTAMVAINSHVVLRIARECLDHDPDLLVVYMGNNEVVGPFGAGTVLTKPVPGRRAIALSLAARSSRLGQLGLNAMEGMGDPSGKADWLGMEMFLEHQVALGDPRLQAVYSHFEANLRDIVKASEAADVPLVLSTVPVNLRNCAPLASGHSDGLAEAARVEWKKHYEEGRALEAEGKWEDADEMYDRAEALYDQFAELHFRRARCALALGDRAAARQRFVAARNLDTLRFRADSEINETIRKVGYRLIAPVSPLPISHDGASGVLPPRAMAGDGVPDLHVKPTAPPITAPTRWKPWAFGGG